VRKGKKIKLEKKKEEEKEEKEIYQITIDIMCTFRIVATLCPCEDEECCQRDKLEKHLIYFGHVIDIHSCVQFRDSLPRCPGAFTNEKPDRLLVQKGMNPNDRASKLDCRYARYEVVKPYADYRVCDECVRTCD
jgi:hypothetical protein